MISKDTRDIARSRAFADLDMIYAMVIKGPRWWDDEYHAKFVQVIDSFLQYNVLPNNLYLEMKPPRLAYNVVPKNHHLWHLGSESRFMNPRCYWVYKNEDYMGKISSLAKGAIKGCNMFTACDKIISRYWQAVQVRWNLFACGRG